MNIIKIKKLLLTFFYHIKLLISTVKLWLGKKLGLIRTVKILPFLGFGNQQEIFFLGRVLKDRGVGISQLEDSRWKNFKRMYKRFVTWEIPDVEVKATLYGKSESAVTDDEGYFQISLKPDPGKKLNSPWQEVQLNLMDKVIRKQNNVTAMNKVVIPGATTQFGIISDIDDTIVPTGATRIWEMLKNTFFRNAHSRVPFPGVSAFYQALQMGINENEFNPIFYVSSSPWNLYGFLMELLDIHDIPKGPLMLRDLGLTKEYFISGSHNKHKLIQVERIFEIVEEIPFILIGDSGQHDPEIYLQVIKDYPGRVKMIYIREVNSGRREKVIATGNKIKKLGVDFLLIKNTMEAARHAADHGWIKNAEIDIIGQEKKAIDKEQEKKFI